MSIFWDKIPLYKYEVLLQGFFMSNSFHSNINPYVSAEISTPKTRTYTVGTEITKGNTTLWAETYKGGSTITSPIAREVDSFAGLEVGFDKTVWSDTKNSISFGAKAAVERETFSTYSGSTRTSKDKMVLGRGLATIGYSRDINPKTSIYANAGFGVQTYNSSTLNTKAVLPAYDATIGVERNFNGQKVRLEAFTENAPNWTDNTNSTSPSVGVRVAFVFGK